MIESSYHDFMELAQGIKRGAALKTEFQKRSEGNTFGVMIPWTESNSKKYYEMNRKLKAKGFVSLHEAARKALEKILRDAEGFLAES